MQFGGDGSEVLQQQNINNPQQQQGFQQNVYSKLSRNSNAYMLVYVREADASKVLASVNYDDIPRHLHQRVQREADEKARRKKEKNEEHLYTIVKITDTTEVAKQIGHSDGVVFDLVDQSKVSSRRVLKTNTVAQFKEEMAKEIGVPPHLQRYWHWSVRQNKSFRVSKPLSLEEENVVFDTLRSQGDNAITGRALKLFLETPSNGATELPPIDKDHILLFFKYYDCIKEELRYVGHLFLHKRSTFQDCFTQLRHMAKLSSDTSLLLHEEVRFMDLMCEVINPQLELKEGAQLEEGDIIVFQRTLTTKEAGMVRFQTGVQYLEYRLSNQPVAFRPLERPGDDNLLINVELSRESDYASVCNALAQRLSGGNNGRQEQDPRKLRFTTHNARLNAPRAQPLLFNGFKTLSELDTGVRAPEVVAVCNPEPIVLYYERLEMNLENLQQMRTLSVGVHGPDGVRTSTQTVHMAPGSTVKDALLAVTRAAKMTHKNPLRLMQTYYSKVYKVFENDEDLGKLEGTHTILRCEEMQDEDLVSGIRLISAYHLEAIDSPAANNDTTADGDVVDTATNNNDNNINNTSSVNIVGPRHPAGDPLLVACSAGESLRVVKERLRLRLGLEHTEFDKWKFLACSPHSAERLCDDDVVVDKIKRAVEGQTYGTTYDCYLGMEHNVVGLLRRGNHGIQRPATGYERAVRIHN